MMANLEMYLCALGDNNKYIRLIMRLYTYNFTRGDHNFCSL